MGIAFGESRGSGVNWDGVYLSGKEGDLVEAVYMGRVVFADWLNGFGLLLIIDHGQGYMTLYGHNQSLLKKVGDWVESLEPVSQVGSSGGNSRSGIYFGIRYKGKPLDPKAWCKDGQGKKMG
jgi:septal ring factor EnvC (AmiA/AmiB activator)